MAGCCCWERENCFLDVEGVCCCCSSGSEGGAEEEDMV